MSVITVDGQDYEMLYYDSLDTLDLTAYVVTRHGVNMVRDICNDGGEYLVVKPLKWKPIDGEDYYMIDSTMSIVETTYLSGGMFAEGRVKVGNYFKTREEAEEVRDKMLELLGGN